MWPLIGGLWHLGDQSLLFFNRTLVVDLRGISYYHVRFIYFFYLIRTVL